MKIFENGIYRDETQEEIEARERQEQERKAQEEAYFWTLPYGERVSTLIRERYSLNDELALQRQRNEKPQEFEEYFTFCEECKKKAKDE